MGNLRQFVFKSLNMNSRILLTKQRSAAEGKANYTYFFYRRVNNMPCVQQTVTICDQYTLIFILYAICHIFTPY